MMKINKSILEKIALFSFLFPPMMVVAFPAFKDVVISASELMGELFILFGLFSFLLKSQEDKKFNFDLIFIFISIVFVFLADAIYGARILKLTTRCGLLDDFLYSGFSTCLAVFLINKLKIFSYKFKDWGWAFLAICLIDAILSYLFLLSPYYCSSDALPWKINATIYMGLTISIFSIALTFVFRVSDRKTFWFLNLLILLFSTDFAIRLSGCFC